MINPWKVHRSRAVITYIGMYKSLFRLPNGHEVRGFDIDKKFKVGDEVNIQHRSQSRSIATSSRQLTKSNRNEEPNMKHTRQTISNEALKVLREVKNRLGRREFPEHIVKELITLGLVAGDYSRLYVTDAGDDYLEVSNV